MRISGTAVPRKTHPTMPFLDVSAGTVARVVVAALGPSQSAQGDGEGQPLHVGLPVGAVWHAVHVGVRDGEAEQDGEEDDEGDDQGPQRLDDGGVAEERQDPLDRARRR